jgi:hypothetical protein
MSSRTGRVLRVIAIVFMALTAAMNLLGGAGTACAAFLTENYESMMPLMDYQWLYQALTIITVAIGLLCIWSTVALGRGKENAYGRALILLLIGTILGGIHMYASLQLRGKAVPANMKFYPNVIALVLLLVLGLPGLRERVGFSRAAGGAAGSNEDGIIAGGPAAVVAGATVLTTELWVGASHVFGGANWTHVLRMPLLVWGTALIMVGLALLLRTFLASADILAGQEARA